MFTSQDVRTLELDVCTNTAGCDTIGFNVGNTNVGPGYMDAAQLYWPSMENASEGKYALG